MHSVIQDVVWSGSEWVKDPLRSPCLEFNRKVYESNGKFGYSGPIYYVGVFIFSKVLMWGSHQVWRVGDTRYGR